MHNTLLLQQFDLLATAPGGVARLRELILTLAVQGKLVPQNPADEPASALLKRIRAEKDRLIAEGKIKRDKPLAPIGEDEQLFGLPVGWGWVRLGAIMEMFNGRAFKPTDWIASGLPIVRIQNLNRSEAAFNYCDPATISEKNKIDSGSFLISWSGTPGTSFGAFIWQRGPAALNQHIFKCELLGNAFVPEFLELSINSQLNVLIGKAQGGVGLQHVTKGALESLVLVTPPLAEQARIVARVEELMRVCDALETTGQRQAAHHRQLVQTLLGDLTADSHTSWQRVADHFDTLLDRPSAVDALEQTILQLAVRGQLVPQDPTEEPASALLKRIRAEKDRLIAAGKIKRDKPLAPIGEGEQPFELPPGWEWVRIDGVAEVQGGIQKTPLRRPVKNHHPYLRVANVQRDAFKLDEIERYELTDDELARWTLSENDLLIVEGNGSEDEIGRCAVWAGQIPGCVYQNHLIRVRCLDLECVQFLKLFLNSPSGTDEMKRLAITTSGLYNLSVGKIRNFAFPLPPLPEQARIVARVAQLHRLCADLRQRLTQSQTTQAALAEALVAQLP